MNKLLKLNRPLTTFTKSGLVNFENKFFFSKMKETLFNSTKDKNLKDEFGDESKSKNTNPDFTIKESGIPNIHNKDKQDVQDKGRNTDKDQKSINNPNVLNGVDLNNNNPTANSSILRGEKDRNDTNFNKNQKKSITTKNSKDSNYNLNDQNSKSDKDDSKNNSDHYCLDNNERETLNRLLRKVKESSNSKLGDSEMNELKDIAKRHKLADNEDLLKDLKSWRDNYYH